MYLTSVVEHDSQKEAHPRSQAKDSEAQAFEGAQLELELGAQAPPHT